MRQNPARPDLWGTRVSNDPGLPDPKLDTGNRQTAAAVGTWTGLRPGPPRALRGPASDWGYLRLSYTFHTP